VIVGAELSACDIKCMGITTQRNTFITWDRSAFSQVFDFVLILL